ncbi:MAG TPA: hypothetical protein DEP23_10960 [Ruminococcaceae bacterium]|nr:hypothetical protein [Oscillospiraceae bacterium]
MLFGLDQILAVPLGYLLWFIYRFVGNYFVAIFLLTLLVRAASFPLALKSQKMQADRARLAPRLERIQKKYAQDKKKLQEKQMALYEKEGVSLTGGCLPMVIQMVVLFGIIAVIYAPLTHLSRIPTPVINASLSAVAQPTKQVDGKTVDIKTENKLSSQDRKGYYKELRLLMVAKENKNEIITSINKLDDNVLKGSSAEQYYDKMKNVRNNFNFFGKTLLEQPWNSKGFGGINVLWIIPLFSWLTAFASSFLSMKFMNVAQSGANQPGQGCQNNTMLLVMPLFSLFIAFTVPGGVGIYWISSNIIAVVQTFILNKIYNAAKIRAQAEQEYQERRRQKREDKKRLAEARARENAELNAMNQKSGKGKKQSKRAPASQNSGKKKAEDAAADQTDKPDGVENEESDETNSRS